MSMEGKSPLEGWWASLRPAEIKENKDMEKALHIRTTVQPGGKIEIVDRER